MTAAAMLATAFATALRRLHFVLLDTVWKAAWLALVAAMHLLSGFILWNFGGSLFWTLVGLETLSVLLWIVMESFFRAALLTRSGGGFFRRALCAFPRFFAASLCASILAVGSTAMVGLLTAGVFLVTPFGEWKEMWSETWGGIAGGMAVLAAVLFAVTCLATLARANASGILTDHLPRFLGVVGLLSLLELLIGLTVAIPVMVAIAGLERISDLGPLLASAGLSLIFLTVVRSYLTIVRYAAVDIMTASTRALDVT